jgi:hypothetical protein
MTSQPQRVSRCSRYGKRSGEGWEAVVNPLRSSKYVKG